MIAAETNTLDPNTINQISVLVTGTRRRRGDGHDEHEDRRCLPFHDPCAETRSAGDMPFQGRADQRGGVAEQEEALIEIRCIRYQAASAGHVVGGLLTAAGRDEGPQH